MAPLTWDQPGERLYETGVDRGVLYIPDSSGAYVDGHAWNGLTHITEKPTGAAPTPFYANNIKWLNLLSIEEFGAIIEAYTYPDAFGACDGTSEPEAGLAVGQQSRKTFGLAYRTKIGNDLVGTDYGYKVHLIYGALAAPSDKAHSTVNDKPDAIAFNWTVTTTPVAVPGFKPSAQLILDATKVNAADLAALELILYGTDGVDARLPLPTEILGIFAGSVTTVRLVGANAPTYDSGTHVVTLPAVTGVQWRINGVVKASGAQPALAVGQTANVTALATAGYVLSGDDDWTFDY